MHILSNVSPDISNLQQDIIVGLWHAESQVGSLVTTNARLDSAGNTHAAGTSLSALQKLYKCSVDQSMPVLYVHVSGSDKMPMQQLTAEIPELFNTETPEHNFWKMF